MGLHGSTRRFGDLTWVDENSIDGLIVLMDDDIIALS
jgi:hypothetical protein